MDDLGFIPPMSVLALCRAAAHLEAPAQEKLLLQTFRHSLPKSFGAAPAGCATEWHLGHLV